MINPAKLAKRKEMERRGCKDCLFYVRRKCLFGMQNCPLKKPDETNSAPLPVRHGYYGCSACPYGRGRPCVSFCMKQLLEDWRRERAGVGKEVSVYA